MEQEFTVKTSYRWWNDDGSVKKRHEDQLKEHALNRIKEMTGNGYKCGELYTEIDGDEYSGWWEVEAN